MIRTCLKSLRSALSDPWRVALAGLLRSKMSAISDDEIKSVVDAGMREELGDGHDVASGGGAE
jgi:hypothetical protein